MPLPPAIQSDFLILQRTQGAARAFVAPALLVAGCAILGSASMRPGLAWCAPASGLVALAGSFALTHSRTTQALMRARFGWCGALPVSAGRTTRALVAIVTVALVAAMLVGSVLLALGEALAQGPADSGFVLPALDGGLAVGTAAAVAAALRKRGLARQRHAEGIREPLFALAWLDDRRLPHVLDWQRRLALVTWRRGSAAFVLVVLVGVPDGASLPMVVGLVVLVGALAWLEVVTRACATVATDVAQLLGATPAPDVRLRLASLRYPLVASLCALILGIAAIVLRSDGLAALVIWCACIVAVAAWPLHRILQTTHGNRVP